MILSAVNSLDGTQLIVCGSPSAEWIEWLRTADVPLTPGQWAWRAMLGEPDSLEVSDD